MPMNYIKDQKREKSCDTGCMEDESEEENVTDSIFRHTGFYSALLFPNLLTDRHIEMNIKRFKRIIP